MSLSQMCFRVAAEAIQSNEPFIQNQSSMKSLQNSRKKLFFSSDLNPNKETPFCISYQGSYTIEAALILPLMISACIFILFFLRIAMVQIGVNRSMGSGCRDWCWRAMPE